MTTSLSKILCSLLVLLALLQSKGYSAEDLKERPPVNGPINLNVGLYFVDFQGIDGSKETFTGTGYLFLEWLDPRLAATNLTEQKYREIKQGELWEPKVEVVNALEWQETLKSDFYVTADGTVGFIIRFMATVHSQMDQRKFPFDEQYLQFVVEPFIENSALLSLRPNPVRTMIATNAFLSEWKLAGIRGVQGSHEFVPTSEKFSRVTFLLKVKRNSGY